MVPRDDEIAVWFKALGNKNKIKLFNVIATQHKQRARGSGYFGITVGEAAKETGLDPKLAAKYIRNLEENGLVVLKPKGRRVYCRVNVPTWRRVQAFTSNILGRIA